MGYLTRFSGEIKIDPPILWSIIKDSKYLNTDGTYFTSVIFKIETIQQDTEYGEAISRKAIALVPCMEDAYKGYDIFNEIKDVFDSYSTDHNFSGEIRAEGEETGDIRRYIAKNNKIEELKAAIIWPDGVEEKL